ncbi:MAG TPA: AAA family ATPase [Longimicrobiales bacterium]|nr:AAA family ATPase [Longimicrobiales bacterium]
MTCVHLTGMSGTGKSTVIARLAELGYAAVDLDAPAWSIYDETGDLIWREERVRRLLDENERDPLFVSGCATNQVKFRDRFDYIILLSAPAEVLVERLRTRTSNDYGKHSDELADVLGYLETVEPLLRRAASREIDTRAPLEDVVSEVLDAAGCLPPGSTPARDASSA